MAIKYCERDSNLNTDWNFLMLRVLIFTFGSVCTLLFTIPVRSNLAPLWSTVKIGGGGFISGMDIQCDQGFGQCAGRGTATKVARTDTYGAYWFNPNKVGCGNSFSSGCWQQIVTITSMPRTAGGTLPVARTFPLDQPKVHPQATADAGVGFAQGVYEIVIAPSNTAHFWMIFNGYVYSSTDKGTSWIRCSLPQDKSANANDDYRVMNKKMAVDPANENAVFVTTPSAGVSYTTTGCRGNWTTIPHSSIAPASGGAGYLVAFDPTTPDDGKTLGVYVSSYGNGVYHTTNYTSGVWKLTTRTPETHQNMIVDATGNVWLIDSSNGPCGALYEYTGGVWSTSLSNSHCLRAVAVNPITPSRIYATKGSGVLYISTDSGAHWSLPTKNNNVVAEDIPWLQAQELLVGNYLAAASYAAFDPAQPNVIYVGAGLGIWKTDPPLSAAGIIWTSQTAAIEQLVSTWIVSPPGGAPMFGVWDQGIFRGGNPNLYPSNKLGSAASGLSMAWSLDWASSSPTTIVGLITWLGVDTSGYSSNGGATWNVCPTGPVAAGLGTRGGSIAASSSTNFVAVGTDNGVNDNKLLYTKDACSTWTPSSFTPIAGVAPPTSGETGWGQNYYYYKQILIADRVNTGTYYAYNYGPGRGVVSGSYDSLTGIVTLTLADSTLGISSGSHVTVSGITGTGGFANLNGSFTAGPGTKGQTLTYRIAAGLMLTIEKGAGFVAIPSVAGFWKSTDGGAHFSLALANTSYGTANTQMRSVPGQSGNFYVVRGVEGLGTPSFPHPANDQMLECTDTGSLSCIAVTNVKETWSVGFGKAAPGKSYPAIYIVGWINQGGGYTFGIWESDDHHVSWKRIGDFPNGSFDQIKVIEGDNNVYGRAYIGTTGSGFARYN